MKYLGLPQYDDLEIVRALSKKDNLASYPLLEKSLPLIEAEYEHYKKIDGNGTLLNPPLLLDDILKTGLQGDYGRKLKVLSYIEEIRRKLSPDVCPMCGGYNPAQVDHFIPKSTYPEFSLFTHNLVPACDCNQKKLKKYKNAAGARILHPYYDAVLNERIAFLEFLGDVNEPNLGIALTVKFLFNSDAKFHVSSIVENSNIFNWASKEWSKIQTRPIRTLFKQKAGIISRLDVKQVLEDAFEECDAEFGTPNNWKSMFYYGLAVKTDYHEYIRDCVNKVYPK